MFSPIEEIKSRLDIVELIQGYIRLQKSGMNYRAVCPFHTEKTPSFFVSPSRQIWHCFGGCGEGGDIFKFVMKIEGLDFPEALRLLAQRAGVILKREDPAIRSERNRLYDLCEEACKIFEKNLFLTPTAQIYLKNRGVREETAKDFRLGFAPQSWDFLLKALVQKGFKKEEIEKAGLAIKSEDGSSHYDRFRSRIMFPITDGNARVIGFGGRVFEQEAGGRKPTAAVTEAKYVNTPNTLIYDKSRALYGFDKAKQEIRAKNQVVAVEGYMDCLMSHQAGVKNTIAVSGTALTPQHLKVLRNLCDTFVGAFDIDSAGSMATSRSMTLAAFDFERKVAVVPKGKDVADLVAESPELWREISASPQPIIEHSIKVAFQKFDKHSLGGKKEILNFVLPELRRINNAVERSHWTRIFAKELDTREEEIWKNVNQTINPDASAQSLDEVDRRPKKTRRELLEERLLTLLAVAKEDVKRRELESHYLIFASAANKELFDVLQNNSEPKAVTANIKERLDLLKFKGEALAEMTGNLEEEFRACKRELEREGIKERLLKIGSDIERLEKEGRGVEVTSLLQDFRSLSEKLKMLS